tara:strand:+ start:33 stop:272 length:240 start_codon:yes stop_codon:yes gene_type:complete
VTHTFQAAIAINRYNIVQTGAKTQSGGVRKDLFNEEYHGSLEDIVATPPIKDAKYVTPIKKIKDKNLFFTIKVLYIIER